MEGGGREKADRRGHLAAILCSAAERFPDRPAVRGAGSERTYRQLDAASRRIAAELARQGVGPGERVGVFMDKSPETVAVLYGILRRGACYVPIDVRSPEARVAAVARDAQVACLVTTHGRAEAAKRAVAELQLRALISVGDGVVQQGTTAIAPWTGDEWGEAPSDAVVGGESLAYILYTSGSTGTPKGVMISHRAALGFIEWAGDRFGLRPDDRVASHAPFHFDLSIFDLYAAAAAGACVCLVPGGVSAFPRSLGDFLEREGITVWYSVPSVLIQLTQAGVLEGRNLSRLRLVLFAGDVFPVRFLKPLMEALPGAAFWNLYGPTETNVCTAYPVRGLPSLDAELPIGLPCEGQEAHVVDESGTPVADGELGELWIGGRTLMSGYWRDPERTGERMRPNPRGPSSRFPMLFRTGDLVCRQPDGQLLFHGRRDHMIKSRGYRIELGEIEHVLRGCADVQAAVAIGVPDEQAGMLVNAAVVLRAGCAAGEERIRRYCSERLPAYMIPERFVFLSELPLTPTGKLDRLALGRA